MTANILDGAKIAQTIQDEIKNEIQTLKLNPTLSVILAGDNEASKIYVKKKCEACQSVGIHSEVITEKDEKNIHYIINDLNNDNEINGILVQLPLPLSWDTNKLFDLINPLKDVDCFNPINVGLLVQNRPRFLPPTPLAIQQMFARSNLSLVGKHVVVINRSNIVGKPLSSILIQDNGIYSNATVTVCHINTPPVVLKQICISADVIVVAVGIPEFLTVDMVREGQTVIDVGITRVGKKIVGDVHPLVREKVEWISPVPGGVGPCTVAMLLYNTLKAARLQNE